VGEKNRARTFFLCRTRLDLKAGGYEAHRPDQLDDHLEGMNPRLALVLNMGHACTLESVHSLEQVEEVQVPFCIARQGKKKHFWSILLVQ